MGTDTSRAKAAKARLAARRLVAVLVAGCCLLACTACGSAAGAGGQPSTGSTYQRLVAAYLDYAHCARTHGMPNLPDPQVDANGND